MTEFGFVGETPRERFERTKEPQDYLRWLNNYTNTKREGDDELHALCSWAHSVINSLEGYKKIVLPPEDWTPMWRTEEEEREITDQEDIDRASNEGM